MSDRPVIVIGAGGHAKVVISALRAARRVVAGIVDDDEQTQNKHVLGVPVIGTTEHACDSGDFEAVIAVGENQQRRLLAGRLFVDWAVVVHPSAVVSPGVVLGPGTVVMAGAVIQAGARVGAHSIVNTAASVDHDCIVGDFVHIAPGVHLGGGVKIGDGAFVGIGGVVLPNCQVSEWAVLGAGAVAIRDLEAHGVAVGVPAVVMRRSMTTRGNGNHCGKRRAVRRAGEIEATFIGPNDPRWRGVLARSAHDIYHLPEYVDILGKHAGNAQALAFYADDGEAACLIPLLRKPLPGRLEAPPTWCDLVSPYGYPGPLYTHPADEERDERFRNAFISAADELGACSAFLRLHPLLDGRAGAPTALSNCRSHGETISIDLTRTEEELWRRTRGGHQYDIRRLEKLAFRCVMDDWSLYDDFVRLYQETMLRLGADPYYRFSHGYFTDLRAALGENLHLCCVRSPDGRPVAGGLFTGIGGIMQYHLSGSDAEFQRLAPTKSMLHFVRVWARRHGYRVLHLGGGLGSTRDALFQFKAGFSGDSHEFRTLRIVVNERRYGVLALRAGLPLDLREDLNSPFFPPYLSGPPIDVRT